MVAVVLVIAADKPAHLACGRNIFYTYTYRIYILFQFEVRQL